MLHKISVGVGASQTRVRQVHFLTNVLISNGRTFGGNSQHRILRFHMHRVHGHHQRHHVDGSLFVDQTTGSCHTLEKTSKFRIGKIATAHKYLKNFCDIEIYNVQLMGGQWHNTFTKIMYTISHVKCGETLFFGGCHKLYNFCWWPLYKIYFFF